LSIEGSKEKTAAGKGERGNPTAKLAFLVGPIKRLCENEPLDINQWSTRDECKIRKGGGVGILGSIGET